MTTFKWIYIAAKIADNPPASIVIIIIIIIIINDLLLLMLLSMIFLFQFWLMTNST